MTARPAWDRTATTAMTAAIGTIILLAWTNEHMPYWAAWTLNTTVTLTAFTTVALIRRIPACWVLTAATAVLCVAAPIIRAAHPTVDDPTVAWALTCPALVFWYWTIRVNRRRPAVTVVTAEQHVVHHHVLHGHDGRPVHVDSEQVPARPSRLPGGQIPKQLAPPRPGWQNTAARLGKTLRRR